MLLLGGGQKGREEGSLLRIRLWREWETPGLASWPPWGEQLPWSNTPTLMCWLPQAPKQQSNWPWIQTSKTVSQNKVFTCKNVLSRAFTTAIGFWLAQKSTVFPVNEESSICRALAMCWPLDKALCVHLSQLLPQSTDPGCFVEHQEMTLSMYDFQSSRGNNSVTDGTANYLSSSKE